MKTKSDLVFVALLVLLLLAVVSPVRATTTDDTTKAKSTLRHMRSEIKDLRRLLRHSKVLAAVSKSRDAKLLTDSDSDGFPDVLEAAEHTRACDSDSDDDGINDGDEARHGTDGTDNTDGELEVTGSITAITSADVTVGTHTCTATGTTEFRDGSSLADYHVGNVVEIKCHLVSISGSNVLALERIKLEG